MKLKAIQFLPALALLLSSAMPGSVMAAEPPWCKKAELTQVETTICEDKTLSKADSLLDQMYRATLSFSGLEGHEGMWPGEIISDQRDFLEERNKLTGKADILEAYTNRIRTLTLMLKLRWEP
jgi:uncharacterized protein